MRSRRATSSSQRTGFGPSTEWTFGPVARDDPRLFDEVLDWLSRNESLISTRRLRTLCDSPEDERLASASLDWLARYQGRQPAAVAADEPTPLFRTQVGPITDPDPAFLAHGLLRPRLEPSGKSREPDVRVPINFAFRLRQLLGVGARAESVRHLLTMDTPWATVADVAASAGYAKRNVQEAISSLHGAGVVTLATVGSEQRITIDRARWGQLLVVSVDDLPVSRGWPFLFSALKRVLRWLDRPDLDELSDYLRASQARDLREEIQPALSSARVVTPAHLGGIEAWDHLVEAVDRMLLALGPSALPESYRPRFEIFSDAESGYRWRLSGVDGRILGISAEAYASFDGAHGAADRFRDKGDAYSVRVEADPTGSHRWRVIAANGRVVALGAESFASAPSAERAGRAALELAARA